MQLKRLILIILTLLSVCPASAYDFEVDGLTYNHVLRDDETTPCVELCGHTANLEGQHLDVPAFVNHSGTIYKVIGIHSETSGAFAHSLITSVSIPGSVRYIGPFTFYNNKPLTRATIESGVEIIGEGAFCDCGLESIIIPASVTEIGEQAFYGNRQLRHVELSPNVRQLAIYVFFGCQALEEITLPPHLERIEACAFESCPQLKSIEIPATVRTIGNAAFSGCQALKQVTLHEGLEEIGSSAFADCRGVVDVTLPASLRSIGFRNFEYATFVARCKGSTPIEVDAERYPNSWCTLYRDKVITVPRGCTEAWKAHEYWGHFNIVEEGNEASLTLDGSRPLDELIVEQCGFTLDDATSLTLAGTISDADLSILAAHRRSLLVLDMSATDNRTLPEYALSCSPYPSADFAYNKLLYLALPHQLESVGRNALMVDAQQFVIASEYDTTIPAYLAGVYRNIYVNKASDLITKSKSNTYCFDGNPTLSRTYDKENRNIYVPWGTRGAYIRALWPNDGISIDDADPESTHRVYNMYSIETDDAEGIVRVKALADGIAITGVTIDGTSATPLGNGVYEMTSGTTPSTISIALAYGEGCSVTLTHNMATSTITALAPAETTSTTGATGRNVKVLRDGRIVISRNGGLYHISGVKE